MLDFSYRVVAAVAAVALLAGVLGCGGGGGGEGAATRTSASVAEPSTSTARQEAPKNEETGHSASRGSESKASGGGGKPNPAEGGGHSGGGAGTGQGSEQSPEGNGGSGGGGQVHSGSLLQAADEVCAGINAKLSKELEASLSKLGGFESLDKHGAAITEGVVIPALEAEIRELRALGGSGSEGAALMAVVGALQEVVAEAQADPQGFIVTPDPFVASKKVARSEGFKECGGR